MKNNMKIVGIISSSHFNGNNAGLVREALKGAAEAGAEVSEIFLPQYRIEYCTGCMSCLAGQCPISDDFETVRKSIYAADGVILASPTFAAAPNAIMKNLFDRLGMFERFTSSFGGKYVAGISTAGSMGAKKVAANLASIATNCIFQRGYISGILGVNIGNSSVTDDKKTLDDVYQLGKKLANDIQDQNKYPFQNLFGRLINRLIIKPQFSKIILKNKAGRMQAVYHNLAQRGLI